ncbi:MAG: WYL domain-containing protein [Ruminococcaceae bacterium]|nr:WYL domain-containing protein [Oscillospiraceae bacterium]
MEKTTKPRLLAMLKILETYSDEQHPLTFAEVTRLLKENYGIDAHRTTLQRDLDELIAFGVDIVTVRSTQNRFFVGERVFQTPELRLLADAIGSSKCLTDKKSAELTEKLYSLVSVHQADMLRKRPLSVSTAKPSNESIYYIIDAINNAIDRNKAIHFTYTDYTPDKQKTLRGDGEVYTLSPYACVWNGDYYYVVGWSHKRHDITVFRVDRIAAPPEIAQESAIPAPEGFDLSDYTQSVFQMYKGKEVVVELECTNDMMRVIIDRFGDDVQTAIVDEQHFKATAPVSLSPTFYGWVFEFGGKIRITAPFEAKDAYRNMVTKAAENL